MGIDLLSPFGEDLFAGPSADVAAIGQPTTDFAFLVDREELIQRIIRRLLTSPGEWLPFPNYGAGLRQRVDEPLTQQLAFQIRNDIVNQILQEPDVARNPMPQVQLQAVPNGVFVSILLFTQAQQSVRFSFNPSQPNIYTQPAITVST